MGVRLSRAGTCSGTPFRAAMSCLALTHGEAARLVTDRRDTARMAYDEELADRVRAALRAEPDVDEKRMFGGLGFMVDGHMAVAASGQGGLLVRVDPRTGPALVDDVLVHRMVMRGREMDGWLRVEREAVEAEDALHAWVGRGVAAARSLASG